ncbi:MAG: hypothetical protein U1E87_03980 [Alphaproteobacteria bacterium]
MKQAHLETLVSHKESCAAISPRYEQGLSIAKPEEATTPNTNHLLIE